MDRDAREVLTVHHGPDRSYPVVIRTGCLTEVGAWLRRLGIGGRIALVSDETVARLYAEPVLEALEAAGFRASLIALPPGEGTKQIPFLLQLYEAFLDAGLDRSSAVVALGGGVVGDLAGTAAATYMRGIPWIALPTTLLAMVDAAIGGKVAVDLPRGKNLVGAFHPPRAVLADPRVLETLPPEERAAGMAEGIKAALIGDPELWALLAEPPAGPLPPDWIRRAAAVKVRIVSEDPLERGRRILLNLGHTTAHALERLSGYRLRHGEAVAVGLTAAVQLASALGLLEDPSLGAALEARLTAWGLPTRYAGPPPEAILAAAAHDKKGRGGRLRWVLPRRVGVVEVVEAPPEAAVRAALAAVRAPGPGPGVLEVNGG